ncbi:MAG: hypothetical protein A2Y17_10520 [Clostridiales bacterium GWF2_38_85]|nr:MAG: hypothetical protein A2Y17_10520 [Clostridiales bacterium GWF2_38_85]
MSNNLFNDQSISNIHDKRTNDISSKITKLFYCPLVIRGYEVDNDYFETVQEVEYEIQYAIYYEDDIVKVLNQYNSRDENNMAVYFSGSNNLKIKLEAMY